MRLAYPILFTAVLQPASLNLLQPEPREIPEVHTSIVISASPLQVEVDRRNSEVFEQDSVFP